MNCSDLHLCPFEWVGPVNMLRLPLHFIMVKERFSWVGLAQAGQPLKSRGFSQLLSTEEGGRERLSGSLAESRHPYCGLTIRRATAHGTASRKRDLNPTATRVVTSDLGEKHPSCRWKLQPWRHPDFGSARPWVEHSAILCLDPCPTVTVRECELF